MHVINIKTNTKLSDNKHLNIIFFKYKHLKQKILYIKKKCRKSWLHENFRKLQVWTLIWGTPTRSTNRFNHRNSYTNFFFLLIFALAAKSWAGLKQCIYLQGWTQYSVRWGVQKSSSNSLSDSNLLAN